MVTQRSAVIAITDHVFADFREPSIRSKLVSKHDATVLFELTEPTVSHMIPGEFSFHLYLAER